MNARVALAFVVLTAGPFYHAECKLDNSMATCQTKKGKTANEIELEELVEKLSRMEREQKRMSNFFERLYRSEPGILMPIDTYFKYKDRAIREIYQEFFRKQKPQK